MTEPIPPRDLAELVSRLRTLIDEAQLPQGPYAWRQCYELQETHWALTDPDSDVHGEITHPLLVLEAAWPTFLGQTPDARQVPLDQHPVLQLVAETLTHLPRLLDVLDQE